MGLDNHAAECYIVHDAVRHGQRGRCVYTGCKGGAGRDRRQPESQLAKWSIL